MINIKNLNLVIESLKLLSNFSLKLDFGEKVGLMGFFGCGKITLLNNIVKNEVLKKSSFKSFEVNFKVNISYISQKNSLLSWYIVLKNFEISNNLGHKFNSNILKDFKIDSKLESYPSELSGGEYQRVNLASALINKADFLIIDEPLIGVDIDLKYKILKKLYVYLYENKNKSLLLVSHEIDILLLLCNKVIFINKDNQKEILLTNKPKIRDLSKFFENDYFKEKRGELIKLIQNS